MCSAIRALSKVLYHCIYLVLYNIPQLLQKNSRIVTTLCLPHNIQRRLGPTVTHQMPEQTIIKVPLKDGSGEVTYSMRGLKEDEVDIWTKFCASVFSYKESPPPASYFGRHYYNDPHRSATLIRVMFYRCEDGTEKIVASVRVFLRQISIGGGESVYGGGIGEVCTDMKHRRRGLSKLLLQEAIRIMIEKNFQVSLLHAAPAFFPVYESSGYEGTISHWSKVKINPTILFQTGIANVALRLAAFPADTECLMEIHQQFSEKSYCGTIIRSKEYWNNYLSQELENSLWVLTAKADTNAIIAWMSIRSRGESQYQLREFGCHKQAVGRSEGLSFAKCFGSLLRQIIQDFTGKEATDSFNLHLPTTILEMLRIRDVDDTDGATFIDWASEIAANDQGWMYRTLPSSGGVDNMPQITEKQFPHLIWPSDSF